MDMKKQYLGEAIISKVITIVMILEYWALT